MNTFEGWCDHCERLRRIPHEHVCTQCAKRHRAFVFLLGVCAGVFLAAFVHWAGGC